MVFTKENHEDYLIGKVIELRSQKNGNLIKDYNDKEVGEFILDSIIGCPIPGTKEFLTKNDGDYSDLWHAAVVIVMTALLAVADKDKTIEEIKMERRIA